MPAEVMEKWLRSKRSAQINGLQLRPMNHAYCKGLPLSVQRGQAEAYWLRSPEGEQWILKKIS